MTDKEIKDLVKDIPELDKAWEKFQSEKNESQRETELEMYRYRMLRERELRKESLPEPEFTKAKRAERTSEVTSEISELDMAVMEYFKEALQTGNDSKMQAFKAGANWQKEQIENRAIWCEAHPEDGEIWGCFDIFNLRDGEKVKVIIIKSE